MSWYSNILVDKEVRAAVDRLEIPFNRHGFDELGLEKEKIAIFFSGLAQFYRRYFRVESHGIEHVPARGRAMLIGNHSGGIPVDGGMVLSSLLLDHEPPRLGHAMVEKFVANLPFLSYWYDRVGQFTGLPEHAVNILEHDRILVVFPEGVRGVGKLMHEGYRLKKFGTGFLRLALRTQSPVIPFAFVGGVEAVPTIGHLNRIGRMIRVPYIPITPYGLPIPLPVKCSIVYGAPMNFSGDGHESDEKIEGWVEEVKERVAELIQIGRALRRGEQVEGLERGATPP